MASQADVETYIINAAKARGVPESIAVAIARAESGLNSASQGDWWVSYANYPAGATVIAKTSNGVIVPKGTAGAVPTSFGPFQLRAGQHVTGFKGEAGLGDAAMDAGIDVTNPDTWQRQVDFAIDYAARQGTFAGTWSTAVGNLAQDFPLGRIIPNVSPNASVGTPGGGSMEIPSGMTPPDMPILPINPAVPYLKPGNPLSGFGDTLGAIASAIAALPGAIVQPFIEAYNSGVQLMSFLGQINIYKRLGLIVLGALVLLMGIILFALSFIDLSKMPVPV